MKNTGTRVKIFNSEYNLIGDNSEVIQKIANYVDATMNRVSYQSPNISVESIAVLSALNIAESYFRMSQDMDKYLQEEMEFLKGKISRLEELNRSLDLLV
ncbi:MAG: cell division protein ZapA [Ignavibacteria bacterium]